MTDEDKKIWKTENPFKVPDGYFENLSNQVFNKIKPLEELNKKAPKKISMIAPWIGLAATFLVITLVYRQLPERLFPDKFRNNKSLSEKYYELSPWDYPEEYEIMEYISEHKDIKLNVYPDSIIFKNINEEDLPLLTLFQE